MSSAPVSTSSFQSASQVLASCPVDEKHPCRAASAVVAAHLPVREPRRGQQKPWLRWNYYKLSLVHTHKTCGSRRDLHQTSCLRCVERCGLLPLIASLSKQRNALAKLFELSEVLHFVSFYFRYTVQCLRWRPDMKDQDFKQRVAFGWAKLPPQPKPKPEPAPQQAFEEDSDEEWEKAALTLCQNLKS